jgi:hypothetical protein
VVLEARWCKARWFPLPTSAPCATFSYSHDRQLKGVIAYLVCETSTPSANNWKFPSVVSLQSRTHTTSSVL